MIRIGYMHLVAVYLENRKKYQTRFRKVHLMSTVGHQRRYKFLIHIPIGYVTQAFWLIIVIVFPLFGHSMPFLAPHSKGISNLINVNKKPIDHKTLKET